MNSYIYLSILISFIISLIIRSLPILIFKKEINNQFLQSFLYYVPYITLSVMTFPAVIYTTSNIYVGYLVLLVGIVLAWKGWDLFKVAILCCLTAYIGSLLIR